MEYPMFYFRAILITTNVLRLILNLRNETRDIEYNLFLINITILYYDIIIKIQLNNDILNMIYYYTF